MGMDICILEWLGSEMEGVRIIEVCLIWKRSEKKVESQEC